MGAWQVQTDDDFEASLRRVITESVLGGVQKGASDDEDLVARLRRYERQALRERLSVQTRQVIASARRLMGDGAEAVPGPSRRNAATRTIPGRNATQ